MEKAVLNWEMLLIVRPEVVDAMVNCMSIAEYAPDSEITALLRGACKSITKGRAIGCV